MGKRKKTVPKEETKRDKFKRIVEPRVSKALKSIRLIGNCSGSAYEYTEDDIGQITIALTAAIEKMESSYASKGAISSDFNLD